MKGILLIGQEKACSNFAFSNAKETNSFLISLEAKDFEKYSTKFSTLSIDNNICLFYLYNVQTLSVEKSEKLLKLMEKSPHLFILSGTSETPWFLRKKFLVKNLDNSMSELNESIKLLMNEPNRSIVRTYLKDVDIIHLFHILKYNVYKSPETLEAMQYINRYIYKSKKDYLLTMLAWVFPKKPFALSYNKPKIEPLEMNIMKKIKKQYPRYCGSEVADLYFLMKFCKSEPGGLELLEEEKSYLGIEEQEHKEQAVFVTNLEEFF